MCVWASSLKLSRNYFLIAPAVFEREHSAFVAKSVRGGLHTEQSDWTPWAIANTYDRNATSGYLHALGIPWKVAFHFQSSPHTHELPQCFAGRTNPEGDLGVVITTIEVSLWHSAHSFRCLGGLASHRMFPRRLRGHLEHCWQKCQLSSFGSLLVRYSISVREGCDKWNRWKPLAAACCDDIAVADTERSLY